MLRQSAWTGLVLSVWAVAAAAQTPQPFPRAGETRPPTSRSANGSESQGPGQQPAPASAPTHRRRTIGAGGRRVGTRGNKSRRAASRRSGLSGVPASQFLSSYDAGRGQRYLLYGTTAGFAEIVSYYRAQLGDKGDFVFKEPPTHVFEVGRFREETMAFPPGVTVKDWTWGGSQGYPNPKLGAQPARYPTIIMIVPPPPAAAPPRK
jgi:hypothetical protein